MADVLSDALSSDPGDALSSGGKFSHRDVAYAKSHSTRDNCMNCSSFKGTDDCVKVVAPIEMEGWCKVGTDRTTGRRYDMSGAAIDAGR